MTRQECIDLLLNLGAEDLTKEKHPNKIGKMYLRVFIKYPKSYIDFNFDYPEYDKVYVFANRRKHLRKYMNFCDVKILISSIVFENVLKK